MRIVVTGFEPFGPEAINPSQEIVKALDPGLDLHCEVLKTEYGYAERRILELFRERKPDLLLMLGLAESAPKIRMERIALNLDDASIPDNGGDLRKGQAIRESGELALQTRLDLPHVQAAMRSKGHDVDISNHAGAYICNHIFYTALEHARNASPATQCLFVHVPPLRETIEGQRLEDMLALISNLIGLLSKD